MLVERKRQRIKEQREKAMQARIREVVTDFYREQAKETRSLARTDSS